MHSVKVHCVKSVRIQTYSGPHFPAFGLNRTRITPNTDTFYAVVSFSAVAKLLISALVYAYNMLSKIERMHQWSCNLKGYHTN